MKTLEQRIRALFEDGNNSQGHIPYMAALNRVLHEVLPEYTDEQAAEIERLNEELSKTFTVAEVRELRGAVLKFSSKAEMNSSGFSRDAVVTDVIVGAFDNFLKEPK